MPKEYDITTIKQIKEIVTKENIDNFLVDFAKYLYISLEVREIKEIITEKNPDVFHWIDDGKNEAIITIKEK